MACGSRSLTSTSPSNVTCSVYGYAQYASRTRSSRLVGANRGRVHGIMLSATYLRQHACCAVKVCCAHGVTELTCSTQRCCRSSRSHALKRAQLTLGEGRGGRMACDGRRAQGWPALRLVSSSIGAGCEAPLRATVMKNSSVLSAVSEATTVELQHPAHARQRQSWVSRRA